MSADKPASNAMQAKSLKTLFTTNLLLERQAFLRKLLDPRRDIEAECGHPLIIDLKDYVDMYQRGDIAARVVEVWPEESWSESPAVFETEEETETTFEQAWLDLADRMHLYAMLQRADILSGIGRYGIILLGIDDGLELNQPIASINDKGEKIGNAQHNLLFLRTFDESLLQVKDLVTDVANPRYGQPNTYSVGFTDTAQGLTIAPSSGQSATTVKQLDVHWSRVVHLADNRMSSDLFGVPRMQKVFNRLLDLKKIVGGSGEMFWKGGFPGLSLETMPGVDEDIEFDADATKEQVEAYMNGLQRYIATIGMQAKSLSVQVADPGPHVEAQIRLISLALSVPWRVFMGSEAAQLASEQDARAWAKRVHRRRNQYLTPYVVRPFVQRLINIGILPEPKEFHVEWPDPNTVGDTDKAAISEKRTNALAKYVQAGADALIPPFHYLTLVLGMKDDEAKEILDEAVKQQADGGLLDDEEPDEADLEGEEDDTNQP